MYLQPVFTVTVLASSDVGLNCVISEKYYKLKRFLYIMHILQCSILTKCCFMVVAFMSNQVKGDKNYMLVLSPHKARISESRMGATHFSVTGLT